MNKEEKDFFIGKEIKDFYVNGYGVYLLIKDGYRLEFDASDGGYSTYEIIKE